MVFKCKICGGNLEIEKGQKIVACPYCGVQQTLPKSENDRTTNLYDRANHFLRNNEYDKAEAIYETILNEDPTDGEAYWSIVLCKYGVEYVKDPKTGEYMPTCNRTKTTSIFSDENYKLAIENSTEEQRIIYEKQAQDINQIQKRILEVSSKEAPYDVFICYKEKTENGERTADSVLAQDVYDSLVQAGLRVFFARISLEDKIGIEYEPYIYAALSSAKVMVVLGTNKEYFEAPWVRNEWSRFLNLNNKDNPKTLIPCFKNMDAYDLPQEFAHLQAQDMSKIGFMQDLVRGIKKVVQVDQNSYTISSDTISAVEKENIYNNSKKDMQITQNAKVLSHREKQKIYKDLEKNFERLGGYLDSAQLAQNCNELYKKEKHKKVMSRLRFFLILAIIIAIGSTLFMNMYIIPKTKYEEALQNYNNKKYLTAIKQFNELGDYNDSSKLTDESIIKWRKSSTGSVAMVTSGYPIAVKEIGTIACLSAEYKGITNVAQVELGGNDNAFALHKDGTIEGEDWTNIVSIKASQNYLFGLKNDGTVLSKKHNTESLYKGKEINIDTSDWSNIVQVEPCLGGVVGLKDDGTVVYKEIDKTSILKVKEWKNIVQLSGSNSFLIGLKEDGTMVSTGSNTYGALDVENETNVIQLSNNYYNADHFAYIKSDGKVRALGMNTDGRCDIRSWDDVVFLYAGDTFTAGVTSNGKLRVVGDYKDGEYDNKISYWSDIKRNNEWRSVK